MKTVIIGGKGKVGGYIVPALLEMGADVVNISRGKSSPIIDSPIWNSVEQVSIDRAAAEMDGSFGKRIAALKPDVVIDMICFSTESMRQLIEPLRGNVSHFLVCGSAWMHGPCSTAPTEEWQDRNPFGEYGIQKHKMDLLISELWSRRQFPGTIVHPGHIVAPGDTPVNPAGNKNHAVFRNLMDGRAVCLPNAGLETLHHVHASDVAQVFIKSLLNPQASFGQGFHAVSPQAVTLRGYAVETARWFGKEAVLEYLPFEEWSKTQLPNDVEATSDHIMHSPCCSTEKARRLLGYAPRYTSYQAIRESLDFLIERGEL